jgi:hypothetical protein
MTAPNLNPPEAFDPKDSPESPADHQPDTLATPEGDNEYPPEQPLGSIENPGSEPLQPKPRATPGPLQTPRGNAPPKYDRDHS